MRPLACVPAQPAHSLWAVVTTGLAMALWLSAAMAEDVRTSLWAQRYGSLDAADVAVAKRTVQLTLERVRSNSTRYWIRFDSGNSGAVTPLRTFRARGGFFCREYLELVVVANVRTATHRSVACRDHDGVWKAVGK